MSAHHMSNQCCQYCIKIAKLGYHWTRAARQNLWGDFVLELQPIAVHVISMGKSDIGLL